MGEANSQFATESICLPHTKLEARLVPFSSSYPDSFIDRLLQSMSSDRLMNAKHLNSPSAQTLDHL